MAVTDAPGQERLGAHETAAALALSDEARWNQTAEDWDVFRTRGTVFAVHRDGRLVATAALLPYGPVPGRPAVAWISMVLVTAVWRRHGLASALLRRCIDAADARGVVAVLDATPAGAAVYGPLGFSPVADIVRMRRTRPAVAAPAAAAPAALPGVAAEDRAMLIGLDRRALGADRTGLLDDMLARPGTVLHGHGGGACLVRAGRTARHIGPLYAETDAEAGALLDRAIAGEAGPLIIDVAAGRTALRTRLLDHGFVEERPFVRMVRGDVTALGDAAVAVATAGPEFG